MVRIYVGPKRDLWVLPEEALCDRVQFFKSAFQSGFRESSEKVLELPEDDPIAFEFVFDYILQDWPDTGFINTLEYQKLFKWHGVRCGCSQTSWVFQILQRKP
jgi:hypothetical protein